MAKCCICGSENLREDAPVLTLGATGYARYLCDDCDALLETATRGTDFNAIKEAMDKLGKTMADGNPDEATFYIASEIMIDASDRAKAIKDGSYDFALDEVNNNEGFDELPEELRESEEDIELDRQEEEKNKKFDKVYNGILIGACVALGLFVVWKVLEAFGIDLTRFFDFGSAK